MRQAGGTSCEGEGELMRSRFGQRKNLPIALLSSAILLLMSVSALGTLNLTVRDAYSGDDIAHVILIYPDSSQQDLGYTPPGLTGSTWDLLAASQILTKGAGTYTLRIIHDSDTDADCYVAANEVIGTYTITFGGGTVVSTTDDTATATNGQPTTIAVLANDLLVDASSFSFGEIPCPLTFPAPSCPCSTYGIPDTQCPSGPTQGINYVQGLFYVTVGDPSLGILSVTNPSHGTAVIAGNEVIYTSDPGYCGIDTFTYTAQRSGSSDTGKVTVNVSAAPPTPQDDQAETPAGEAVLIDVLSNDFDSGGGTPSLAGVGSPAHGTATIIGDAIRYTPNPRYEGLDRFTYTVHDVCGGTEGASVEVRVLHANHPPVPNAGALYRGIVGEPVPLDASFTTDPDIEDALQYRWDFDDDGRFDTDWMTTPRYAVVYDAPFVGRVRVEVRDLYRGLPTGETATATALVRVDSLQTIQIHVFEDIDGDAVWSDGEPGVEGVEIEIADEVLRTELDGRVSIELDAGTWEMSLTAAAQSQLEGRGFAIANPSMSVTLRRSEHVVAEVAVVKTSTKLKGTVYSDSNENGKFDEEDRVVPGLLVVLDGDEERAVVTDAEGGFSFLAVSYGAHSVLVAQAAEDGGEDLLDVLVPIALARTEKPEVFIEWPYDLGPEEGFLRIDVEKGEGGG
jgi:hypothetical protein